MSRVPNGTTLSWSWKVQATHSRLRTITYHLDRGPADTIQGVVVTKLGYCDVYAEKGIAHFRMIRAGREYHFRREFPKDWLPNKRQLVRTAAALMRVHRP